MLCIVHPNQIVASILCEQVENELGIACQSARTMQDPLVAKAHCVYALDYAKAPLRLGETLSAIEAAWQRSTQKHILALGKAYQLLPLKKQLVHKATGNTIDLTDKEAQLLQELLKAKNHTATKDELLKKIWGFETEINTHTLETHIYRLRAKLKDLSGSEMIAADEGGYKLEFYNG